MEAQPYSNHKAKPIYVDSVDDYKEYPLAFDELKNPKIKDELEDLSLKLAAKTREISDLYNEFNQKLAKFKANK